MKRLNISVAILVVVLLAREGALHAQGNPKVLEVNCDKGEMVTPALSRADPGDTIRLTGNCSERLVITTDRLTLDGQGSAVVDGGGRSGSSFAGAISVDGARGVVIQGLTAQNGPNGIALTHGAVVRVRNSTARNNAFAGIQVGASSTADLTDCTLEGNSQNGADVFTSSTFILRGAINASGNAVNGMAIQGGSMLEIRGATVQASNNKLNGVVVSGAQAAIWGFSESQGSSIVANANAVAGMGIAEANLQFGGGSGPNTITAANNGAYGIFLPVSGSIDCPFGSGAFNISNNPTGLYFGGGSRAIFHGDLTVRNNKIGILADSSGTVNVNAAPLPIPPHQSIISGNDTDIDLRFGSRAIFGDAITIGTIKCDKTALSRGAAVCP
jgi:Periplasmic copper-binding protein (NosD)